MKNSYDVAHGLSQVHPGPEYPVEIAQQPGAAPATGNTARDQEMYAAGIRTGEENAKHNAAIRGAAGWLPIESAPKDGRRVLLWNERYNAAITGQFYGLGGWKLDGEMPPLFHQPTHWMPLPAAPGVSKVEDEQQTAVPADVMAALDRMCTPLDTSVLKGATAEADAFCMQLIRDYILRRPAPAAGDALDAARWRFVRRKLCLTGNGDGTCAMHAINLPASIPGWPEPGDAVAKFCDDAIDAAIAAQRKGDA